MRGLILGSGGSKGAYQVGTLSRIATCKSYKKGFGFIAGSSVGALNAAYLAQFDREDFPNAIKGLRRIWESGLDLLKWRWPCGLPGLWKESFSLNDKLKKFIDKYIDPARIRESNVDLSIVAVELDTGTLRRFGKYYHDLPAALLASSAIPGVFPPVAIEGVRCVDGAVKDQTPLKAAIQAGCSKLLVLPLSSPEHLQEYSRHKWTSLQVLLHSLDIQQMELLQADLAECDWRNKNKDGRRVHLDVWFPEKPFGSSLDFSRSTVETNIKRGRVDTINRLL